MVRHIIVELVAVAQIIPCSISDSREENEPLLTLQERVISHQPYTKRPKSVGLSSM